MVKNLMLRSLTSLKNRTFETSAVLILLVSARYSTGKCQNGDALSHLMKLQPHGYSCLSASSGLAFIKGVSWAMRSLPWSSYIVPTNHYNKANGQNSSQ
jgi:hypothetical protein